MYNDRGRLGQILWSICFLLISISAFADNGTSTCANTVVNNDADNSCYTITPPRAAGAITVNGAEGGGEWSGAKAKNLSGTMAGSFKVLRDLTGVYFIVTVSDGTYHAADTLTFFVDPLHNHATTADDIQFQIKRDTGGSPDHRKVTSGGSSLWDPAALGSALSVSSSGGSWTVEIKLSNAELGVSDLPPILGFGIQATSLPDSFAASWPTNLDGANPSTSWANLKTRFPIEYMMVIDKSGSMLDPTASGGSDRKWDNAIDAANYLANAIAILRDAVYFNDRLGAVTFNWDCSGPDGTLAAKALSSVPAFPAGNYMSGISDPVWENCTPIASGVQNAFNTLGTTAEETQRFVLLLTDGMHNMPNYDFRDGPAGLTYTACNAAAWDECDSLIQVNTVAFGEGDGYVDTQLIDKIRDHFQGAYGSKYDLAITPIDLKEAFLGSLEELYQVNMAFVGASGAEFAVDPSNRKLIVVAAWNNPASADTFKLQQKPTAGDPWSDVACNASAKDNVSGFAICAVDYPANGTWHAVNNMNAALAADRLFVLLDLNLRARFKVAQAAHGTGMDIILTADLNQAGQALTNDAAHPVQVKVDIEKPDAGLGTVLSTTDLDSCKEIRPQLPKIDIDGQYVAIHSRNVNVGASTASAGGAAQQSNDPPIPHYQLAAAMLDKCGPQILPRNVLASLPLYDDGTHGDVNANDGVYTHRFNNTEYEGSYVFRFNAEGTTPDGDRFTRTSATAEYVQVDVDPANSESGNRILSQAGNLITQEFWVIPRDRFGGYLGPGHANQIKYLVSGAQQLGEVRDYNNGIYSVIVQYDRSKDNPTVIPIVQDKPIAGSAQPCQLPQWVYWLIILMALLILLLWYLLILCKRRR